MPSRIWSDELGKWVLVEEEGSKLAVNTQVFDVAGHYHDLENEGDKIVNVEECLEEIGNKLNSGDIGAIGEIKEQVNNLDERVTYIEENGGGGGGGSGAAGRAGAAGGQLHIAHIQHIRDDPAHHIQGVGADICPLDGTDGLNAQNLNLFAGIQTGDDTAAGAG